MSSAEDSAQEQQVEIWKVRRLIKSLQEARGNGTSMISLIIPPDKQLSQVQKMLSEEYGTASNIKSRVNRLSVLDAITSTQQRLKLYNKIPPNGLVVYCGTVMTDDNKTKKRTIDFEPFRPINTSLYLCDNKFHTEPLNELLESNDTFGFVVMDGSGALFGTLCGNAREILQTITVELPKKHRRGGQSAARFSRLRTEKRHNYLRKVAELTTQHFITNDRPNVVGLILAGSADFKTELSQSDLFDQRLVPKILKIVDIPYGGFAGFNAAIEMSKDCLSDVRFIHEKKIIDEFFEQISKDTGKYTFGVQETFSAMEMGSVETLIVWENLETKRYILKNPSTGEVFEKILTPEQTADSKNFQDPETGVKYDIEEEPLLEWLATNYKKFGCKFEFVSDRSPEGAQFVKGFGGIGGILRYRVDMQEISSYMEEVEEWDDLDDFI